MPTSSGASGVILKFRAFRIRVLPLGKTFQGGKMKITKYIHSCLVIEKGTDRLLFDPGLFTFTVGLVKQSQFENIGSGTRR